SFSAVPHPAVNMDKENAIAKLRCFHFACRIICYLSPILLFKKELLAGQLYDVYTYMFYLAGCKSSMESISIYSGTTKPILAPLRFSPRSTKSSLYCSYRSPCVAGNQAATVPSASPLATDCHIIALSSGVNFTSKPWFRSTSPITFVEAISESHSTKTSSISSPFTFSVPLIHSATLSSLSFTHVFAASSIDRKSVV